MNEYWKKHLLEYDIEITSYEEIMRIGDLSCVKMLYKSFDSSLINTKLIVPTDGNGKVLLIIHGLGDHITDFYDILPFSLLGYTVATIDIRSQGGESKESCIYSGDTKRSFIARGIENGGEHLYYKNVLLDCTYLCDWLKNNEYTPQCSTVDIFGGSQGGGLGLMIAALREDVSKAVIAYPYLADIWTGLYSNSNVYEDLSKFLKHNDPLGENEEEFKVIIDNIDPINFINEINCEILYAQSHIDQSVPLDCQQNMYKKLKCSKELVTYKHHGHEKLPKLNDFALEFFMK